MAEETIQRVLKQYYGHTAFRPGQEELIQGILAGRDALGVMPTGGGSPCAIRSLPCCFAEGSPWWSPPDLPDEGPGGRFGGGGIPAAFLNSSLDGEAFRRVCREIHRGGYKLLYVAPGGCSARGLPP